MTLSMGCANYKIASSRPAPSLLTCGEEPLAPETADSVNENGRRAGNYIIALWEWGHECHTKLGLIRKWDAEQAKRAK